MPTYQLDINGKTFEVDSPQPLDEIGLKKAAFGLGYRLPGKGYSLGQFAEDAANVGIGMAKGAYAVASPMLESAKQIKQGVAEAATPFLEGRIPDSTESVGGALRSAMGGVGLASAPFTVPLAAVTTAAEQVPVVGQPIAQTIHNTIGAAGNMVRAYQGQKPDAQEHPVLSQLYEINPMLADLLVFGAGHQAYRGMKPEPWQPTQGERAPVDIPPDTRPAIPLPAPRPVAGLLPPPNYDYQPPIPMRRFYAGENGLVLDQANPVQLQTRFVTTPNGRVVDISQLSPAEQAAVQRASAMSGRPVEPQPAPAPVASAPEPVPTPAVPEPVIPNPVDTDAIARANARKQAEDAYYAMKKADEDFRKLQEAKAAGAKPSTTLGKLIKQYGRQGVDELVGQWDGDARLSEDGSYITTLSDPRNHTGKVRASTKDFILWLDQQGKTQPATPEPIIPKPPEPAPMQIGRAHV